MESSLHVLVHPFPTSTPSGIHDSAAFILPGCPNRRRELTQGTPSLRPDSLTHKAVERRRSYVIHWKPILWMEARRPGCLVQHYSSDASERIAVFFKGHSWLVWNQLSRLTTEDQPIQRSVPEICFRPHLSGSIFATRMNWVGRSQQRLFEILVIWEQLERRFGRMVNPAHETAIPIIWKLWGCYFFMTSYLTGTAMLKNKISNRKRTLFLFVLSIFMCLGHFSASSYVV